jgi:hypothetical protein
MRIVIQVITICCFFIISVSAHAAIYTFKPYDPSGTSTDIMDLDHTKYYDWVINWTVPSGQVITGAELIFCNIYNWTEEDDRLYIHLIDEIPINPITKMPLLPSYAKKTYWTNGTSYTTKLYYDTDNQNSGDNWANNPLIKIWTDPDDNEKITTETFAIPTALLSELSDGSFGIGLDPDCHYYNDGVKLKITTAKVPEPGTLVLLGSGLLSFLFFVRRRKQ